MHIEEIDDSKKVLEGASRILITTRGNPGFDDVASCLALTLWLSGKGKERVDCAIPGDGADMKRFSFLPGFEKIQNAIRGIDRFIIQVDASGTKVKELSYDMAGSTLEIHIVPVDGKFSAEDVSFRESSFNYDVIITVGVTELASVGPIFDKNRDLFFNTPIVNIDRSPSNVRFGQTNVVAVAATSLAEICYEFCRDGMTKEIATCLFTGLMTATNSFQSAQVTPDALKLASDLIVAGASRAEIVDRLYRTKDVTKLKTWGRVLSHLQQAGDRIVYSHLTHEESGNGDLDLSALVEELVLASPAAHIVLFFFEDKNGSTRVYAYARENYDLPILLKRFNPEGRRRHAVFTLPLDTVQAEVDVLTHLKDQLSLINP